MNANPATVSNPAVTTESLATLLHHWAGRQGDEIALTYLDYRTSEDGRATFLTWRELDDRVSAVASRARELAEPGDRAAVLVEQSADYVVAFLGAIRAGLVAVPLFAPNLPGHAGRLSAVLADCDPRLALTTAAQLDAVGEVIDPLRTERIAVDLVPTLRPAVADWQAPHPDDLAYLQYTSGSTRTPAGVMLSHRNVVANAKQACRAYGAVNGLTTTVSWLPLFHDMGLVLGIAAPMAAGIGATLLDPIAFLQSPGRWLRALSASPGAISAAPNFAYGYSASRVPAAERNYLELSRVVSLINGSEPVLPSTIAQFQAAFGECGLDPAVHRASYGLAEATVLVSVTEAGKPSRQVTFDRDRLAEGTAVPGGTGESSTLVSCGFAAEQELRIVDPETRTERPDGTVGEIWVRGENVGRGYWGDPEKSAETFGLRLAESGDWLATGDLGVVFDGELYVTGRRKDLVIVDGRNHYPQDIEQTVETHPAVRRHSAAAFAIPLDEGEGAVVVLERAKDLAPEEANLATAAEDLRAEVSSRHGLKLVDLVFLEPGEVPRTSSGKISRSSCRARYLDGAFADRRLS
ncbi:fatty acyl-AMP ligase [Amycolatopsis magusensis]|uniref:Acyl-CoA synthetase (AMP-forming)/AMP-acid ligase II n=1 Tax=Amycolatopsis magusensis TaxID=882444 RepID=A0ABS4PPI1_9PSEU|nr:fatty acyl-AMP ligase [Amycolatopsis magusensis]MBP2180743.1 acyl-CoA synthetase (AMP-forming)/AMP-acid ligase II [Amycolatopsis magusensis]